MKKILLVLVLVLVLAQQGYSETVVSGVLSGDIIWTEEASPYVIEKEVIIDSNSTLTIEPGAQIVSKSGRVLLWLKDEVALFCKGTEEKNIVFERITIRPKFVKGEGWCRPSVAFIENTSFLNTTIASLPMSFIGNRLEQSHLEITEPGVIEKNVFKNAGISFPVLSYGPHVARIENNLFVQTENYQNLSFPRSPCIEMALTEAVNFITIQKNTFFIESGKALRVTDFNLSQEGGKIDVRNNFWMTPETSLHESEITSLVDFSRTGMQLDYLPALEKPDLRTPKE